MSRNCYTSVPFLYLVRGLLSLFTLFVLAWPAAALTTTRVSAASDGTPANMYASLKSGAVSADGRYAVFSTPADNIVPGDTNGVSDVFVHDMSTGTNERVSVTGNGAQVAGDCYEGSISGDGRYVVFSSASPNLVPGDTNNKLDVILHDRLTGVNTGVSTSLSNICHYPFISTDGRFAVFGMYMSSDNQTFQVYVANLQTGTLTNAGVSWNHSPAISADGRYVAFNSLNTNQVPEDTNNKLDIFVYDQQTGATERVSLDSNNNQFTTDCYSPSLSADGRWVSFGVNSKIYVRDRLMSTSTLIYQFSTTAASPQTSISADGSRILFITYDKLVARDTNGQRDVYLYDRPTNSFTLVSVSSSGQPVTHQGSDTPVISADGRHFVYRNSDGSLAPGTVVSRQEVFMTEIPPVSPDAMLRLPGQTVVYGDDWYHIDEPVGLQCARPDAKAVYFVRIQNDGSDAGVIKITGESGAAGWTARYFHPAGQDFTDTITGIGWSVSLAPNSFVELRLEVTPPVGADPGSAVDIGITATAQTNPACTDTIVTRTTCTSLAAVSLAANPPSPQTTITPITLTATPTGGEQVEYQFRLGKLDATGWHWSVLRPYGIGNTCTTTLQPCGLYTFVVYAREVGSCENYEVYQTLPFTATIPPLTGVSVHATPPAPQPINTSILLTAAATGGSQVEYQFREGYQTPAGWTWRTLRAYSPVNTCTWTPTEGRKYTLVVWAREVGSTRSYQVYGAMTYQATLQLTAVSLSATPESYTFVNSPVTLTAAVIGGKNVEYQFRVGYQPTATTWNWTTLQDYSTNKMCTWHPGEAHLYTLVVWAREVGTTAPYKVYQTLRHRVY